MSLLRGPSDVLNESYLVRFLFENVFIDPVAYVHVAAMILSTEVNLLSISSLIIVLTV